MGKTATARPQGTEPKAEKRPTPKGLIPFKPGQSGNPAGRPKGVTLFRMELGKYSEKILQTLLAALDDNNGAIRIRATELALAYLYGKPGEAKDVAHDEAFRSMLARVVDAGPVSPPQLTAPEVLPPTSPEPAPVVELPSQPPQVLPEEPAAESHQSPSAASGLEKPHGLRCLYRGKDGQCTEMAGEGTSWCAPHKAKLLGGMG